MARERRRAASREREEEEREPSGASGRLADGSHMETDEQMKIFTTNRVLFGLVIAFIIHVVLLTSTSIGYIKTQIFGISESVPKEVRLEKARDEAFAQILKISGHYKIQPNELKNAINPPVAQAAKPSAVPDVPTGSAADTAKQGRDGSAEDPDVEAAKNTDYYKQNTEAAKPNEIPTAPTDEGGLDSVLDSIE